MPTTLGARRKEVTTVIREAGERRLNFTISTGAVDRDRDTIDSSGWRLEDYVKNPVVLFSHEYQSLPVARTTEIFAERGKLQAVAEFPERELYPFAHSVFELARAGYLNAASVGFQPLTWTYNEERRGYDFLTQELLEWSVVPVPSNPSALVQLTAKAPGLRRHAEQLFRVCRGDECVTVPAGMWEALRGWGDDVEVVELDCSVDELLAELVPEIDEAVRNRLTAITGRLD